MEEIEVNGKTYYANKVEMPTIANNITQEAIGKYVIVRSKNEGVNFGLLKHADETGCVLEEARRLWRLFTSKGDPAWYEGVSKVGLSPSAKISTPVKTKIIVEDYSLTVCEEAAIKNIKTHIEVCTEYEG